MGNTLKIDLQPSVCNICGGKVIYTSNSAIYGKEYGSGFCYLCTECRAYVGTHKPRPKEALGILSTPEMRSARKYCHSIFDSMWKLSHERKALYQRLADDMGIPFEACHFGYFTMEQLQKAFYILSDWVHKGSPKEVVGKFGCRWSDGLGTSPTGEQCGECYPGQDKYCKECKNNEQRKAD